MWLRIHQDRRQRRWLKRSPIGVQGNHTDYELGVGLDIVKGRSFPVREGFATGLTCTDGRLRACHFSTVAS